MSDATLRSKSYAKVIDLLCEGPIEGLATKDTVGEQSVLIDETPLRSPDGSLNHQGISATYAYGYGSLGPLHPLFSGWSDTESLVSVGVELKAGVPIVRAIGNAAADAVKLLITVPALSLTNAGTGDVSGTSVTVRVEIQPSGGAWTAVHDETISGRTASQYQRQVYVQRPAAAGAWAVRLIRLTDDSDSTYLANRTYWTSLSEVTDEKLIYPHSVMVGLSIDAENFGTIPSRAYVVKGLKVQIPSNYDPVTRTYTGAWDGLFKPAKAWTDNPAWCFYDLLTSRRYGLGRYVGVGADKWMLYQIGRYCDELVPDGFGGTEPRWRCNLALTSRAEAYRVVQDMAGIFNGMVFWAAGSVTAVHDAPSDPVALYTPANVLGGAFSYSGASAKARHTAALVTWNDPEDLHRQKVEYVEDTAGVTRYGLILTEVAAIGCTSRGQASRVGKWLLYSERLQTETVSFKAGLDTLYCRPGQVIKVADPGRAGVRMGGRLLAATTTSLTLDAAVTLAAGQSYTLSTMRADMTIMSSTVTTGAGSASVLTVSPALPEVPAVGVIWVLNSAAVEAQLFRVLAVTEAEPGVFEVTALEHDPGKYAAIEQGLKLEPRSISALRVRPGPPTNLAVTESLYARGAVLATRLDVSWTMPDGANACVVSWRRSDGVASPEAVTYESGLEIDGAQDGQVYDLTVFAQNPLGLRSESAATMRHTVVGKTAPPSGVSGFVVARTGDQLAFTWRPIADLDAELYEIRLGATWDTAVVVGSAPHPTNAVTLTSPRGGTFLLKARDTSGGYSDTPAVVVAPDVLGINVVVSQDEGATGWTGTKTSTTVVTTGGKTGVTLVSGATTGTYVTPVLDIGVVAYSLLALDTLVETLGVMYMPWSTYTQPWSAYTQAWQAAGGTISAAFEVRTSTNGTTWTAWATFLPGAYQVRYVQIRVTLGTSDATVRPFMTRLALNVDVPDRRVSLANVAVPAAGKTVTFSPAFVAISTAQITLQSAAPGDNATVTAKTASSLTVRVYNAAGTAVSGTLDIDVFGYGESY